MTRIFLMALLLIPMTAESWQRNPKGGKWPGDPATVNYFINMSLGTHAEDQASTLNAAFQWNSSGADFGYMFNGWNDDFNYINANTTNTVMSIDDGAPFGVGQYGCYGKNYGGDAWGFVLGFNLYWVNSVGQIYDSYVVICEKWRKPTTGELITINWAVGTDLPAADQNEVWGTIAHEMGHMLGLGHSCDKDGNTPNPNCPAECGTAGPFTEATMCWAQPSGNPYQRDLAPDDVAGITWLYGAAPEPPPPDPDGDGINNPSDNCPTVANPDQLDTDHDGIGNLCDEDDDGDGLTDLKEIQITKTDPLKRDTDGDGANDWKEFYGYLSVINSYLSQDRAPWCGDETCNNGETCGTCASDCGVCQPIAPTCGDGIINVMGETCDDGNLLPCDGCSSLCKITYQCNDKCDNDHDEKIDCMDEGCHLDNDPLKTCNPSDNREYVKKCIPNKYYLDPSCGGPLPVYNGGAQ